MLWNVSHVCYFCCALHVWYWYCVAWVIWLLLLHVWYFCCYMLTCILVLTPTSVQWCGLLNLVCLWSSPHPCPEWYRHKYYNHRCSPLLPGKSPIMLLFHKTKVGTSPRLTTQPPPSIMWQAGTHPPTSRTTITCNKNEHSTSTDNIMFVNLPNLLTIPAPYCRASIGLHWLPSEHLDWPALTLPLAAVISCNKNNTPQAIHNRRYSI